MVNVTSTKVYDRYSALFKLEISKGLNNLRVSRLSNDKFRGLYKIIRGKSDIQNRDIEICSVCGFVTSEHDINTHKRFHVFFQTKFDKYKPFKSIEEAENIGRLAVELLRNEADKSRISDGLLVSAIESLILSEYTKYITLNIRYASEYQSGCEYAINIDDAMDIVNYTHYAYDWLCVHFRELGIDRPNVVAELMEKYGSVEKIDKDSEWSFGVENKA